MLCRLKPAAAKVDAEARLVTIDGAGHVLQVERPKNFLAAIMKW